MPPEFLQLVLEEKGSDNNESVVVPLRPFAGTIFEFEVLAIGKLRLVINRYSQLYSDKI